jgi:hypothetical protein
MHKCQQKKQKRREGLVLKTRKEGGASVKNKKGGRGSSVKNVMRK